MVTKTDDNQNDAEPEEIVDLDREAKKLQSKKRILRWQKN